MIRYAASLTRYVFPETGVGLAIHTAELSPCGRWLTTNVGGLQKREGSYDERARFPATDHWKATRAEALAAKAPDLRALASRLLEQADELERAAEEAKP